MTSVSQLHPQTSLEVLRARINYEAAGEQNPGPALILIHGFGATLESWHDIFPHLAARWPTIRLDLLGSGFSDKPDKDTYSPQDQASLVLAFIARLGFPRVVLVGHSLGGGIALLASMAGADGPLPFLLAGLILIDSAGYPQQLPFNVATIYNPISRFIAFLLPPTLRARLALRRIFFVRERVTEERVHRYAYFLDLPGSRQALVKTAHHLAAPESAHHSSQFSRLTLPTLVVWGVQDSVIPVEHAHHFIADISGSQLRILQATGHVPHEERPEETLRAITSFMDAL